MKKPTDINDLHVERDLEEVKTCIDGATKPEPAEAVEKAEDEKPKCPTQSQVLMCIARDQCDLYHCEGEAYATTPAGATFAVRSKGFRMFLSQRFVGASGRAPSSQALHEAIDTIEAVAMPSARLRCALERRRARSTSTSGRMITNSWRWIGMAGG